LKGKGPHVGAYCANCGKWLNWLPTARSDDGKLASESQQGWAYNLVVNAASENRELSATQASTIIKWFK
jgi:hypothetical protein